jgi:hypothetical protein
VLSESPLWHAVLPACLISVALRRLLVGTDHHADSMDPAQTEPALPIVGFMAGPHAQIDGCRAQNALGVLNCTAPGAANLLAQMVRGGPLGGNWCVCRVCVSTVHVVVCTLEPAYSSSYSPTFPN